MKKWTILLLLTVLLLGAAGQQKSLDSTQQQVAAEKPPIAMALTFDDGPSAKYTPQLLDGLRDRGVRATFFLVGEQVGEQAPLVRRMAREGHQIGNHSYSHHLLEECSDGEALQELQSCDLALRSVLGPGEYWVRPPYGSLSDTVRETWHTPVVCWSVDPKDWECRNTEQVVRHIMDHVEDGGIILLHDCYDTSVAAALQAIDQLQAQGVEFMTVEELLARKGAEAVPGKVYRKIK